MKNDALSTRKPRADAQRNRDLIIQVAKAAFTEHGAGASLDDIAKSSGVGSGTLYRHFPTREALLEAVYHAEVDKLADAAEEFSRELPPLEALKAWLLLFIDYLATKKIIAAALQSLIGGPGNLFDESLSRVHGAVKSIFDRAVEAGEIREDVNPVDVLRALVGVTFFGPSVGAKDGATRLMEILIQGSMP
jgi:AcrR family transcriptional regulator